MTKEFKHGDACLSCKWFNKEREYSTPQGEVHVDEYCDLKNLPTSCKEYAPNREQELINAVHDAKTPLQQAFRMLILAAYKHEI